MKDLTGKRFGKLIVIGKTEHRISGSVAWLCKCDCGNKTKVSTRDLNRGAVKSCGCLKKERYDIVGKQFGELTVIKRESYGPHASFLCKCSCGNTVSVRGDSLRRGKTVSCGCLKSTPQKAKQLKDSRHIVDHTSNVFFKGTVSKNSITGINGVTVVKGKYRAYIGYKNKIYHLVTSNDLSIAKQARVEAEKAVKNGTFEEWISVLKEERRQKGNEKNNRFDR